MEDQQKKIAEYKHYHMCLYQCILPGECSFTDVDWHHCEGSDPPRTSLKSRIAPQNCCTNNNQWKMLIQLCIRSTKVTADEIGWTPIRNFGTMWFIRSRYWFFGPIRYSSPAPHLITHILHVITVVASIFRLHLIAIIQIELRNGDIFIYIIHIHTYIYIYLYIYIYILMFLDYIV